jgi:hypothetical protein
VEGKSSISSKAIYGHGGFPPSIGLLQDLFQFIGEFFMENTADHFVLFTQPG